MKNEHKAIADQFGNIAIKYEDGMEHVILWREQLVYEQSVMQLFYRAENDYKLSFVELYQAYLKAKKHPKRKK
jgi:hypothetical protein